MSIVYILIFIIIFIKFIELVESFLGKILYEKFLRSIILIGFYRFLIFVIKIFIRNNFGYLIRFLLLRLGLKARSRVILKSSEISRFIYVIKK